MQKSLETAINLILEKFDNGEFTTYGEVAEIINCPPILVDRLFEDIDDKCKDIGLPPISTLIINKETGICGDGYFRYHFSHDTRDKNEIWLEQVRAISTKKYREIILK